MEKNKKFFNLKPGNLISPKNVMFFWIEDREPATITFFKKIIKNNSITRKDFIVMGDQCKSVYPKNYLMYLGYKPITLEINDVKILAEFKIDICYVYKFLSNNNIVFLDKNLIGKNLEDLFYK